MCGIVGLFLKDRSLEPQLGALLTDMLITMTDRGPDSAGIAIYAQNAGDTAKLTVQSATPDEAFDGLADKLGTAIGAKATIERRDSHAVLSMPREKLDEARGYLRASHPDLRIMSSGDAVEIYKEVGLPKDVAERFSLSASGTYLIPNKRHPLFLTFAGKWKYHIDFKTFNSDQTYKIFVTKY